MLQGNEITRRGTDVASENFTPTNELEKFYQTVDGRANILHDYNLYNYNWTIVSLSKDQIENPDSYKGKVFQSNAEGADYYIVARSGGYTRTAATPPATDFDDDGGSFAAKSSADRQKDLY